MQEELCGPPVAGKTTLAKAILRRCRNAGFTPYVLSRVEEWHHHIGEGFKSVVLMDGTLGQVGVNRQQHDYWESILDIVRELTARRDGRLVLTFYPDVLRELQQLERGSRSPLLDPSVVVNMPDTLDRDGKEKLLNFHLEELRLEHDAQRHLVEKILQKDDSGPVFPWCCDHLVHSRQSSDDPTAVFTVPAKAYVPLLTRMLNDPDHSETFAAVLALAMKGLGGSLRDSRRVQPHLRELCFHDYSEYRLEEHADKLKGSILAEGGHGVVSRVLYDAAGLALGRSFSLPVLLKVCDNQFLVDYVCTERLEFFVYVRHGDSEFRLLQQRLTDPRGSMPTSLLRWWQQQPYMSDGVLKRFFALLLLPKSEDHAGLRTKSFLDELKKLRCQPLKTKVKVALPLRGPPRSNEARHQESGLKKTHLLQPHGVCYLDNPSLPIPDKLLSTAIGEDEVSVELSSQHWKLVLRLLADREVDETDSNGNTLLHLAAETGERQIVDIAVRSGASVTFNNNKGLTPNQLAQRRRERRTHVKSSYDNSCKDLHKARVKVALCDKGDNNETPLHSACCAGQLGVASLLVQLGADIHAKNAFDNTAPDTTFPGGSNTTFPGGTGISSQRRNSALLHYKRIVGALLPLYSSTCSGQVYQQQNICFSTPPTYIHTPSDLPPQSTYIGIVGDSPRQRVDSTQHQHLLAVQFHLFMLFVCMLVHLFARMVRRV